MGHKVFVSYKYWDWDVRGIQGESLTTARSYVDKLQVLLSNGHIYKGEGSNEDLSGYSEAYIWSKLKDKIYDSSVTIVLISPNMKEAGRWERSQWIPWEISYSLRETPRNGRTSHSNAMLAVILPDYHGSYDYYNVNTLFPILAANIRNKYIPVVKWDNFITNPDYYIALANVHKLDTPSYKIQKML
jgi:hypothetical protein